MFAEFLFFLLVFPCVHTSVGLTVFVECFSRLFGLIIQCPLCLGSLKFGGGSAPIYTCDRRESNVLLLLILA